MSDTEYTENYELAGPSSPLHPVAARYCLQRNRHRFAVAVPGQCGDCGAELGRTVQPATSSAVRDV